MGLFTPMDTPTTIVTAIFNAWATLSTLTFLYVAWVRKQELAVRRHPGLVVVQSLATLVWGNIMIWGSGDGVNPVPQRLSLQMLDYMLPFFVSVYAGPIWLGATMLKAVSLITDHYSHERMLDECSLRSDVAGESCARDKRCRLGSAERGFFVLQAIVLGGPGHYSRGLRSLPFRKLPSTAEGSREPSQECLPPPVTPPKPPDSARNPSTLMETQPSPVGTPLSNPPSRSDMQLGVPGEMKDSNFMSSGATKDANPESVSTNTRPSRFGRPLGEEVWKRPGSGGDSWQNEGGKQSGNDVSETPILRRHGSWTWVRFLVMIEVYFGLFICPLSLFLAGCFEQLIPGCTSRGNTYCTGFPVCVRNAPRLYPPVLASYLVMGAMVPWLVFMLRNTRDQFYLRVEFLGMFLVLVLTIFLVLLSTVLKVPVLRDVDGKVFVLAGIVLLHSLQVMLPIVLCFSRCSKACSRSQHDVSNSGTEGKLDYTQQAFQRVLQSPTLFTSFKEVLAKLYCLENGLFYQDIRELENKERLAAMQHEPQARAKELRKGLEALCALYIEESSPRELNLGSDIRLPILKARAQRTLTLGTFDRAKEEAMGMMFTTGFAHFVATYRLHPLPTPPSPCLGAPVRSPITLQEPENSGETRRSHEGTTSSATSASGPRYLHRSGSPLVTASDETSSRPVSRSSNSHGAASF